jgi:predicted transcriptional regulator
VYAMFWVNLKWEYFASQDMKSTNEKNTTLVDRIKSDIELRPFFIDYIAENLKLKLASFHKLNKSEMVKFKSNASKSLNLLVDKLSERVEDKDLDDVITKVCQHYTQFIALVGW